MLFRIVSASVRVLKGFLRLVDEELGSSALGDGLGEGWESEAA